MALTFFLPKHNMTILKINLSLYLVNEGGQLATGDRK